ncbi:phosphoribosyltransferase [Lentzea flaviverrucosa]|uniref:Predicted phosphoribosyltransferase n=1 Tax=Lentzea flaviverrucosa TaxID=200379 RepID=A0A1H9XBB5_9PSEU|nr:phosphoribosyltransferase family protein [Lentzea flaviverrucosa]RDI21657.1 putative phosphoribosyltransferase [Lentzea flaviverrucosa]SES43331.1 Predicted phosphoribosyltransferase [Lentzea flaviverrucosa]
MKRFANRQEAGRALAARLADLPWHDPLVLGLPRGGVPVAKEIAHHLNAELDVVVARKIGAPGHPEYGVGAVTADSEPIYDPRVLRALNLTEEQLGRTCDEERAEAKRRTALYRGDKPLTVKDRDVILVDDGLATGVTARAALHWIARREPRSVTLAVPVAARDSLETFRTRVVAVLTPKHFQAVSRWYESFDQTTDEEVLNALS